MQGDDLKKWNAGLSQLEKLGLDPERREKVLKQGFGWSTQKYWWKQKVNEVPQPEEIEAKLSFFEKEFDIKGDDMKGMIEKFPELLGLSLDKQIQANLKALGDKYYISTNKLKRKTILRKPEALGFMTDCEGDCQGDCTRCFQHL